MIPYALESSELQLPHQMQFSAIHRKTLQHPLFLVKPVSWGCTIHWLHLCSRMRLLPTIILGMTTKQSDSLGALENVDYHFIAITSRSTLEWFSFSLVSFVSEHINFPELFNVKVILIEEQQWYKLIHSSRV